ncbi:hypothetical protein Q3G72_015043 [Acer saccharum]|nr:hypothetical protein Q3G72_015043 [Acer saccharum]
MVNLAEIGRNNRRSSQVGKNGVKDERVNIDSNGSTDVGRADSFSFGGSLIQRSFAEVVNNSQIGLHENAGVTKGPARIDKGYPTFQSFQRKGYGKNVKGGSDVRGLPLKAVAFQNSKEVIWRMEGQHANLASDGETCSFSSESDIKGLWKGESSGGVPLDDKTSSSPIKSKCSMEDNSPRKCSIQYDSK